LRENDDGDLRDLFQNLREDEQPKVPGFQALWARARQEASLHGTTSHGMENAARPLHKRLAWTGGLLAAAATTVLLLLRLPATSDADFVHVVEAFSADPAGGAWRSPTDALLKIPGEEILSTVPTIATPPWFPEPGTVPRGNEL